MCFMYEPRSKYWYDDEDDSGGADSASGCSDIVLFPLYLLGGILLVYLFPVLLLLFLIACGIRMIYTGARAKIKNAKRSHLILVLAGILIVEVLACLYLYLQIRSLPSARLW